jgi:Winged helix DNA-binding domain
MGRKMAHDALAMIEYRDSPPVCLIGDSQAALRRIDETAAAAGCRVAVSLVAEAEVDWESECAPGAPVLVELDGSGAESATLALLDWVQREARTGRRRAVISAPSDLTDLVAARVYDRHVSHLCQSAEPERVAEVAFASRRSLQRLHDISRDDGPLLMKQLSEDVGRIAAILASLSEEDDASEAGAELSEAGGKEEPGVDAAFVRSIIRARRLRDQFFRGGLFADPAWDMLLDLMAARLEETRVAVSSLCIAAAVPATTALRWIKALTDRGLFVRSADPQDGRRVYIALSDDAARALTAYLRAVQRLAPNAAI